MTSRKFDELATDIDDASAVVEELQADPNDEAGEKLNELHDALEQASDTIDEIGEEEEGRI